MTIAIVAILLTLAAPSFTPLMERWRVRQAAEELTSTVYYARSEAIKRAGNVAITKQANGAGCTTASGDTAWGCGWTVSSGSITLQETAAPTRVEVTLTDSTGAVMVDRWGMLTHDGAAAASMDFLLTPQDKDSSDASAVRLCVGLGGRIVKKKGSESC